MCNIRTISIPCPTRMGALGGLVAKIPGKAKTDLASIALLVSAEGVLIPLAYEARRGPETHPFVTLPAINPDYTARDMIAALWCHLSWR